MFSTYLYKLNSKADLLECYFFQDIICADVSGGVIIFRAGPYEIRSQVYKATRCHLPEAVMWIKFDKFLVSIEM
jgi:hypothetical protein